MQMLLMYNGSEIKPTGKTRLQVINPKNLKKLSVDRVHDRKRKLQLCVGCKGEPTNEASSSDFS